MTAPIRSPRLLITGTDTNVGKTHVTCLIARQMIAGGFRVAAYKPVCSGAITVEAHVLPNAASGAYHWEDVERLKAAIGEEWAEELICPQRFLAPLAPPVAARLEGRDVDFSLLLKGADRFDGVDLLLIEGAGGWLSPVTETKVVADLGRVLNVPVLIIARAGLGTINHTLMTIESVRACGLTVAGVILNELIPGVNDPSCSTNAIEIEARSGVPVLGTVPYGNSLELHQSGRPVTMNWRLLAESVPLAATITAANGGTALRADRDLAPTGVVALNFMAPMSETALGQESVAELGWPNWAGIESFPNSLSDGVARGFGNSSAEIGVGFESPPRAWIDVTSGAGQPELAGFTTRGNRSSAEKTNSFLYLLLLLVGSYASLLTIYLIYLIFLNRDQQLESLPDLKTVQENGGRAIVPRPENDLPWGHDLRLGETRRYGDLRVTPLRVTRGPLRFVHASNQNGDDRDESGPVLKLWLKFENVSAERAVTPLDSTLVFFRKSLDDRVAAYNVIFKARERGSQVATFCYVFSRLAVSSDWRIVGQQLNTAIAPQDVLETFIPSEERPDWFSGDLIWRVHFRKGYGPKTGNGVTTLIDVRFNSREIRPDSA